MLDTEYWIWVLVTERSDIVALRWNEGKAHEANTLIPGSPPGAKNRAGLPNLFGAALNELRTLHLPLGLFLE
jgi:hypothetical protein